MANDKKEVTTLDIIIEMKYVVSFLLRKWKLIVLAGLIGGGIGLTISYMIKPKYVAHLSFSLVEKNSGSAGSLADLASSFGYGGLFGGNDNAFSGDNLLEIMKSRHCIENTLLTPVVYSDKKQTLADLYIQVNELRKDWNKNTTHPELRTLSYPVGQDRKSFSRAQDSILFKIYDEIVNGSQLIIMRKDKKLSFVNVDFKSKNELFAKLFIEELLDNTYLFYRETKTSQSKANVIMMQQKADSIRKLYDAALYKGAGYSSVNINMALQYAAVPKLKQDLNAQLYGTVYAEVLKNLEALKLDLARETPIIQIIDRPIMPLKKEKFGKIKSVTIGGVISVLLVTCYLLMQLYLSQILKKQRGVS